MILQRKAGLILYYFEILVTWKLSFNVEVNIKRLNSGHKILRTDIRIQKKEQNNNLNLIIEN